MGNLFKRISSYLDGPGAGATLPATAPAEPVADSVAPDDATPADGALTLTGGVLEPHRAFAHARRPSRALNALGRAATAVVVARPPMPLMPASTQQAHLPGSVELTEAEQVRLGIMQAQIKLSHLMLYDGPINGVMNPDTVAGVRHFQVLKGLRDSGELTAATMRALVGPGKRRG